MSAAINWETVVTIVMFFISFAGLLKYVFYLLDKHKETVDGRFKEHKEKLTEHKNILDSHGEKLSETREEMHRDFVKHEHLNHTMDEIRTTNAAIFDRLNNMDQNLNQVIGAFNGKVKENDR